MIAGKNIAIYGLLAREDWLAASTYYVTQFFEIFDSTSSPSIASLSSILQFYHINSINFNIGLASMYPCITIYYHSDYTLPCFAMLPCVGSEEGAAVRYQ